MSRRVRTRVRDYGTWRAILPDPATAAGEPHHIELATMLVVRESTGPPRPR